MFTAAQAQAALALRANEMEITREGVIDLLVKVKGTTFAHLVHCTDVTLSAAARKAGHEFVKLSSVSVQLFNNIKDFRNVYEAAVKRSAERLGQTAQADIDNFEVQSNWFEHDPECYSLVHHKEHTEQHYLYFIANGGESLYYDVKRGREATKQDLYPFLTPSGERALSKPSIVENKATGVVHDVTVRVVKLENVLGIRAMGYELDVLPVKRKRKA